MAQSDNEGARAPVGALGGMRVVDLTQMLAGPYCTMLLADLGADVVKVESPQGDGARRFGPFHPDDQIRAFGGYFQSVNRNKRSVVVDLKHDAGLAVLWEMIAGADILVENFRFGVMDRLGLDFEVLHQRFPSLIYASIRGHGDRSGGLSPRASWPAYDLTAQALGGFMSVTGYPDQPLKSGPGLGDIVPALMSSIGILAAVAHRYRTGEGQYVDVAMYDSILAVSERIVHQLSYTGQAPGRQGNTHPLLAPFDVFRAADGWVTIASPSDAHWRVLCSVVDSPVLDDVRLDDNEGRLRHSDLIRKEIGRWTEAHTRRQILDLLGGRFPVAPVNDAADIARDPHVAARDMIVNLEHPGVAAPVGIAGSPIKLSATPPILHHRAPLLGEHTAEILAEAGFDSNRIEQLRTSGAVFVP